MPLEQESRGSAERIIQSLLTPTDHLFHNRPGMVVADARASIGVRWAPVTHKVEGEDKVVYSLTKVGNRQTRTRVGVMQEDLSIVEGGRTVGQYRPAGIFPEVAQWMYQQVADIWSLDNEFAARWASYSFTQEHRDLKIVLASFLLCQSRKGAPEFDGKTIIFHDEDYRDVGEAMLLLRSAKKDFDPKMLLRVRTVLTQPAVAEINTKLGFGVSTRNPFLGRWAKGVTKWLRYRESNPYILQGLVKAGFRKSVIRLAQLVGYKPMSKMFFQTLRWKQKQSTDGRRSLAIGMEIKAADSWEDLTEIQICQKIMKERPSYKVLTSKVPPSVGVTRAIVAAAIEAGSFSDQDLIIAAPTLEGLGLLEVQEIKIRWEKAVLAAENQRATNVARNVRNKDAISILKEGADNALKKKVEEVTNNLRIYVFVDISSSMRNAIEEAKSYLEKFVQAFPLDRLHVAVFNSVGREVKIKHASAKGVNAAFAGIQANGCTSYGEGVRSLEKYKPADDEDSLFIFVGDEGAIDFKQVVVNSGLRPAAFGLLRVGHSYRTCVTNTASQLGIPCFALSADLFADPYAVPRVLRNLVASTPVGNTIGQVRRNRVTMVDTILSTELLAKPAWATL